MDLLMVLIVMVGIAVSIANKKNNAKAQKQRQASQGQQAAGPKPAAPTRTPPAKTSTASSRYPSAGSSKYPPAAPKRSAGPAQKPQAKPAVSAYGGTPQYTHVVTSTLEGGHTHTESSMTGEEACPPPKIVAVREAVAEPCTADKAGTLLGFEPNSVLQGILYAEILGKPKSLQR